MSRDATPEAAEEFLALAVFRSPGVMFLDLGDLTKRYGAQTLPRALLRNHWLCGVL
jgi:hypothetical protein